MVQQSDQALFCWPACAGALQTFQCQRAVFFELGEQVESAPVALNDLKYLSGGVWIGT